MLIIRKECAVIRTFGWFSVLFMIRSRLGWRSGRATAIDSGE